MRYVNEAPKVEKDSSGQTIIKFQIAGADGDLIELALTSHAHTRLLHRLTYVQPGPAQPEPAEVVPIRPTR